LRIATRFSGVVDPAKLGRTAPQNAASAAGLTLTAVAGELPRDETTFPVPPPAMDY